MTITGYGVAWDAQARRWTVKLGGPYWTEYAAQIEADRRNQWRVKR